LSTFDIRYVEIGIISSRSQIPKLQSSIAIPGWCHRFLYGAPASPINGERTRCQKKSSTS
jgi:hypothetical protein